MSYKRERQHRAHQVTEDSLDASHLAPGAVTLVEAELGAVQRKQQPAEGHGTSDRAGPDLWASVDASQFQPGETLDAFSDVIQGIGAVQRARATDNAGERDRVGGDAHTAIAEASESVGAPLPGQLRGHLESSFGADLGAVRVHTGASSAKAAEALDARAYAVGQDVHFGAGQYDPSSREGQHLISHEVAHTIQQRGASPTPQFKLAVSSPSDAAEIEADRAADAVMGPNPREAGAIVGRCGGSPLMLARTPRGAVTVGETAVVQGSPGTAPTADSNPGDHPAAATHAALPPRFRAAARDMLARFSLPWGQTIYGDHDAWEHGVLHWFQSWVDSNVDLTDPACVAALGLSAPIANTFPFEADEATQWEWFYSKNSAFAGIIMACGTQFIRTLWTPLVLQPLNEFSVWLIKDWLDLNSLPRGDQDAVRVAGHNIQGYLIPPWRAIDDSVYAELISQRGKLSESTRHALANRIVGLTTGKAVVGAGGASEYLDDVANARAAGQDPDSLNDRPTSGMLATVRRNLDVLLGSLDGMDRQFATSGSVTTDQLANVTDNPSVTAHSWIDSSRHDFQSLQGDIERLASIVEADPAQAAMRWQELRSRLREAVHHYAFVRGEIYRQRRADIHGEMKQIEDQVAVGEAGLAAATKIRDLSRGTVITLAVASGFGVVAAGGIGAGMGIAQKSAELGTAAGLGMTDGTFAAQYGKAMSLGRAAVAVGMEGVKGGLEALAASFGKVVDAKVATWILPDKLKLAEMLLSQRSIVTSAWVKTYATFFGGEVAKQVPSVLVDIAGVAERYFQTDPIGADGRPKSFGDYMAEGVVEEWHKLPEKLKSAALGAMKSTYKLGKDTTQLAKDMEDADPASGVDPTRQAAAGAAVDAASKAASEAELRSRFQNTLTFTFSLDPVLDGAATLKIPASVRASLKDKVVILFARNLASQTWVDLQKPADQRLSPAEILENAITNTASSSAAVILQASLTGNRPDGAAVQAQVPAAMAGDGTRDEIARRLQEALRAAAPPSAP